MAHYYINGDGSITKKKKESSGNHYIVNNDGSVSLLENNKQQEDTQRARENYEQRQNQLRQARQAYNEKISQLENATSGLNAIRSSKLKQSGAKSVQELLEEEKNKKLPSYSSVKEGESISPSNNLNKKISENNSKYAEVNNDEEILKKREKVNEIADDLGFNKKLHLLPSILKTGGNIATNVATGALRSLENFYDFSLNASTAVNTGLEELLGMSKESVKKERESSQDIIKRNLANEGLEKLGWDEEMYKQWEKDSLVKRDNLGGKVAQGIGEMIPQLLIGGAVGGTAEQWKALNFGKALVASAPTNLGIGITSYGGGLEEAYSEGANMGQANKYALGSALVEIGTEWLTGGVPGVPQTGVFDKWTDKVLDNTANSMAKFLKKEGFTMAGEGIEEFASEIIKPFLQNATYTSGKKINLNEAFESFVVGGLVGGILELPGNMSNYKADVNSLKEEFNKNILQEEQGRIQNPSNLIEKNQNNINLPTNENSSQNSLNLPINTNENITTDNSINNNTNPLENLQQFNETKQQEQAQQMLKESSEKIASLENELNNLVPTASTEGMNLQESAARYNIDPQTQAATQTMMENRGIEARWDGTRVEFKDGAVNAVWSKDENGNRSVIFNPNASENTIIENIAVHELAHDIMSSTESRNTLKANEIMDYVKTLDGYEEARQNLVETYSKQYDPNSKNFNSLIDEEVVADVLGRKLGNQEFINRLNNQKPKLARNIYNWVVEKLNSIVNHGGKVRSERLYWENVKNRFETAFNMEYKNYGKKDSRYTMTSTKGMKNGIATDNKYLDIKNRYIKALELSKNGKYSNEEIRKKTGWFKDNKGNWEFEISDHNIKFKIKPQENGTYKLEDLLDASVLYDMYPGLKNIDVQFKNIKSRGIYNSDRNTIKISNKIVNNSEEVKGTLLHEIQHYVQHEEGLPTGTTILFGNERYANSKGEIEAADTKRRMNLSVEERKKIIPESAKENPIHPDRKKILERKRNKIEKIAEKLYNIFGDENSENFEEDYDNDILQTNEQNTKTNRENQNRTEGLDNSSFSNEKIQGLESYSQSEIKDIAKDYINNILQENGYDDIGIKDIEIHGSRKRGTAKADSDLDVVIQYDGDIREDDFFNILNNNGDDNLYIDGIRVDINPIQEDMSSYMGRSKQYDKKVDNENPTSNPDIKYSKEAKKWDEFVDKNITTDNHGRTLSKEQQEYFKDSKVRDKNGNLEVVYHGSKKAGFTTFKTPDNVSFFTDNEGVAETYSGAKEKVDTRKLQSLSDAKSWLKGINEELYIENNKVYDYDGEEILSYDNQEDLLRNLKRGIQIETGNTEAGGIYEGYANITNPYVLDVEGKNWNNITIGENTEVKKMYESLNTKEKNTLSDLADKMDDMYDKWNDSVEGFYQRLNATNEKLYDKVTNDNSIREKLYKAALYQWNDSSVEDLLGKRYSTNDIVIQALRKNKNGSNYDGVIFKNIIDEGLFEGGTNNKTSTVYVIFNPNQFKAIDNTNPTSNEDIRYSKENKNWSKWIDDNFKQEGTTTKLGDIKLPTKKQPTIPTKQTQKETTKQNILPTNKELANKKVEQKVNKQGLEAIRKATNVGKSYLQLKQSEVKALRNDLKEYLGLSKEQLTNAKTYNGIKDKVEQFMNKQVEYLDEDLKRVKKEVRNTKIKVDPSVREQITDYGEFRKQNFGKLRLTSGGINVDSVYSELSELYPYYFDSSITSEADMLYELSDFMNKPNTIIEEYKLSDSDIKKATDKIFNSLIDNSLSSEDIETMQNDILDKYSKRTRKVVQEELLNDMGITVDDISVGKDISALDFQRTDPIRLNEKVFGAKIGQKINDETINKTKHNEAERTRFLNKERNEIKELGIKPRSKESAAVQKYGEKQYVNSVGELVKYGDVELANEFSNVKTQEKIKHAAEVLRNKYDKYIEQINNVITELGYDPIPKRPDYMRHFQEINDKLSQWGIPLNPTDLNKENIPTDINGLTDQFRPGKNWFASAMQRKGFKTTYDAITGIDGYLEGASNLIYHTEDIQRYRTLSKFIRETYGQTHGMDNVDIDTKEGQQRLNDIFDNKLSKYVAWLDEQANSLAGKKGGIDRAAERLLGRKVYTILDTAKKQVGSNMTGFNVRSALTNFASAVQGASKTNKLAFVKGTLSTLKNIVHNDGMINKSDFLTNRFGSDQLSKKAWQKASNAGQIFMTGSDYFTANQIWRSKYYENLSKKMSESQAIKNADDFASRIMGDRSKGATAEIFNSKTLGLLTQFQLEVNNQWSSIIHDNKMDIKRGNKSGATVVFQLGQLAAMSYFFNNFMKSLTGSDVMIDPIDMFKKLLGSDDDDDDEEKTLEQRATEVFGDLINDLPFASFLTGGRIPMAEAFTGVETAFKKLTNQKDKLGNEIKWSDVGKDTISSGAYWLLPTGYGQIRKTTRGLSMYDKKLPVPGSYTESGNLRFDADESTGGKVKAALFGQYSSKQAQDYINSGYKTIRKQNLPEMKDLDMNASEYRKYREALTSAGKKDIQKINYVDDSNYTEKQKNIMYKNILDLKEKEAKVVNSMSLKDQNKYLTTRSQANSINSSKDIESDDKKQRISNLIIDTNLNDKNMAYLYSKYYSSEDKINMILDMNIPIKEYIKADNKEVKGSYYAKNGKIVKNSKRNEYAKYINSLNLSVAQKAILIKMKYNSFKTYDNKIVNYINNINTSANEKKIMLKSIGFKNFDKDVINYINSQHISKAEKEKKLKGLGFTIRNGRVYYK